MVTHLYTKIECEESKWSVNANGILPLQVGEPLTIRCYTENPTDNLPPGNYVVTRIWNILDSNGSEADDNLTRIIELGLRK